MFEISDDLNKNSRQPADDRIGKEAQIGVSIDYQGVPYYQQQLNEYLGRIARNMERVVEKEPEQDKTGVKNF